MNRDTFAGGMKHQQKSNIGSFRTIEAVQKVTFGTMLFHVNGQMKPSMNNGLLMSEQ